MLKALSGVHDSGGLHAHAFMTQPGVIREYKVNVMFEDHGAAFRHPPQLSAAFNRLEVFDGADVRIGITIDGPYEWGFGLTVTTYTMTRIAAFGVSWMAIGESDE